MEGSNGVKEIKGFPLKDHVSRRLYCKRVFIFSWPPTPSHPMAGENKWHFKRGAFLVSGRWDYKKPECLVSWCKVTYTLNSKSKGATSNLRSAAVKRLWQYLSKTLKL